MKTKNYFIIFFTIFTTALSAQDLIIKSLHKETNYDPEFTTGAFADNYNFSIVELKVLNNSISPADYDLNFKRGSAPGDGTANQSITIGSGENFFTKDVTAFDIAGTVTLDDAPATLTVGSSLYFVEMYNASSDSKLNLTNQTLYKVFADYMGFTSAQMLDKIYITVNSTNSYEFNENLLNTGAVLKIKSSSGSVEDIWKKDESSLAAGTLTVRTTEVASATYIPSQWDETLAVNNNYNHFESENIQNPIASGDVLTFQNTMQKEIKIYDFSGTVKVEKVVGSSFVIPGNLTTGVYFLRVNSQRGVSVHKLIIK